MAGYLASSVPVADLATRSAILPVHPAGKMRRCARLWTATGMSPLLDRSLRFTDHHVEMVSLPLRQFAAQEPIDIGALVELEREGERMVYFVGPLAGGVEMDCEGQSVQMITPHSPMGRQLVGHKQGERLNIQIGRTGESYRIAAVS